MTSAATAASASSISTPVTTSSCLLLNEIDLNKLDEQIDQLMNSKPLAETEVETLCEKAKEILQGESNVQPVRVPVTVVGDIHGQFGDLKEMLAIAGSTLYTLFRADRRDGIAHSFTSFTRPTHTPFSYTLHTAHTLDTPDTLHTLGCFGRGSGD
eukprot:Gregarina_sp_Poly_1__3580@NODE_2049_length_2769_cov_784_303479_g706_i1_p3_GENE_NODE_2049_length_2769_cov_784_303479_g706_i1NODE_2049_length_2769_cov_784_303479_g706_i1_p3_ORF_typecomplete_len155_score18_13STPPase_N/PF16891_5/0_0097Metallophos/PF00149_28/0_038_NODE_2049_length_2769_cov_784_303479_g706_i152516